MSQQPKVSITVITYNHGTWLAKCLESVVTQKTNFPFEIIVGDDASPDQLSQEILHDYAKKFPEILTAIQRPENIGGRANYFDVVSRTKGKYIAHIDGDDYMYPGKLQKQVEILDCYPNIAIVGHDLDYLMVDGQKSRWRRGKHVPKIGCAIDLLKHRCYFGHSSKMYRRSAVKTKSTEFEIVDYWLHLEHAMSGNIYHLDEVLGAYRIHPGGDSKRDEMNLSIFNGYMNAYDYAIELGLPLPIVERSRIAYKQATSIKRLRTNNYQDFSSYIKIEARNRRYASSKQLLAHYLGKFPHLFKFAYDLRSRLKKL